MPDATLFLDLHTHSHYSDGLPQIGQIEDHCRRTGMGVALTDHNEVRGSLRLVANSLVPCVPAVEVGTREGLEFLVYFRDPAALEDFYRRAMEPHLRSRFMVRSHIGAVASLEAAVASGGFVSLAHPYAFGRKSLDYHREKSRALRPFVEQVLRGIHAVEHFNAGILPGSNRRAADLHREFDKKITIGSDAHRLGSYGAAGVTVGADMESRHETLFDLLEANAYASHKADLHCSPWLTVPIIAAKHTRFFLGGRRRHVERAERMAGETSASPAVAAAGP